MTQNTVTYDIATGIPEVSLPDEVLEEQDEEFFDMQITDGFGETMTLLNIPTEIAQSYFSELSRRGGDNVVISSQDGIMVSFNPSYIARVHIRPASLREEQDIQE